MSFFFDRYKEIEPDFKPIIPEKKWLRINTLKINEEELIKRLEEKGVKLKKTVLKNCYEYESEFSLSSTPEYLLGYIYLQNLASQSIAHIIKPKETDTIIDLASAPGSKTTHLAQLMNNKGRIIAVDNNPGRLLKVRYNCERLGVFNVVTIKEDGRFLRGVKGDVVLLDAPCSGNYCSEEDWLEKRTLEDINKNARMQKELIRAAINLTKDNGTIIYSTCSLEPEEDEKIIEWALENFSIKLEKIESQIEITPGITEKTKLAVRFWPYKTETEGFFICKMKKNSKNFNDEVV